MKRIASRDNPFFKQLRRWAGESATRRDDGIAVLEGVHLTAALLASGGIPTAVVVGASALRHPEVVDLLSRTEGLSPAPERYVLDDALFAAVSGLAQGVALLMVMARPRPAPPDRVTVTAVVLDRVQDPGNVGSILRSAAAAAIDHVYLSRECAGAWSPKVLRAAMGAHFALRLFDDCDLSALKDAAAIPWIATSPHAARSLYDVDLRGPVAWVFGHEGQGVDPALARDATLVRIPQPGAMESLNVAATAAICFFEQVRQRS